MFHYIFDYFIYWFYFQFFFVWYISPSGKITFLFSYTCMYTDIYTYYILYNEVHTFVEAVHFISSLSRKPFLGTRAFTFTTILVLYLRSLYHLGHKTFSQFKIELALRHHFWKLISILKLNIKEKYKIKHWKREEKKFFFFLLNKSLNIYQLISQFN